MIKTKTTPEVTANPIEEFTRLILINHTVSGDLISILTDIYNSGIEIGKIEAMFSSDFQRVPQVKKFNLTKVLDDAVRSIKPERISNIRTMKYFGPDIKANAILVSDYTVKQTIRMLASRSDDYQCFERNNFDKKEYAERLKGCADSEEKNWIVNEHNTLEVRIFVLKCYQVGFSEGTKKASRVPHGIRSIFEFEESLSKYNSGDHSNINTDELASSIANMVVKFKEDNPTWHEYAKFYENTNSKHKSQK